MRDWSDRDRGLAEALTIVEDGLCPGGCGQKRDLAWNGDTDGWWEPHEVVCAACAELERAQKEVKEPEPGVLRYVSLGEDYEP